MELYTSSKWHRHIAVKIQNTETPKPEVFQKSWVHPTMNILFSLDQFVTVMWGQKSQQTSVHKRSQVSHVPAIQHHLSDGSGNRPFQCRLSFTEAQKSTIYFPYNVSCGKLAILALEQGDDVDLAGIILSRQNGSFALFSEWPQRGSYLGGHALICSSFSFISLALFLYKFIPQKLLLHTSAKIR